MGSSAWLPTSTSRSKSSGSTWSESPARYSCAVLVSNDDPKLVPYARAIIEEPSNRKCVSLASCWEIAIKIGLKKLDLGEPATTFLPRELAANMFELLGIELSHATFVESMPTIHRDPFDRLLVAQVIVETMSLVSADPIYDRVRKLVSVHFSLSILLICTMKSTSEKPD